MPYSVQLDQPLGDGRHFQLFMAAAPLGRKETRTFSWCSRNYDLDASLDQGFVDFQTVILDQDRLVVESQRPEELPVDLSEELHIKGVDQVSIEYRRWLLELASSFTPESS
jgi:vanillate O-demethylase monooxygenase subunit